MHAEHLSSQHVGALLNSLSCFVLSLLTTCLQMDLLTRHTLAQADQHQQQQILPLVLTSTWFSSPCHLQSHTEVLVVVTYQQQQARALCACLSCVASVASWQV